MLGISFSEFLIIGVVALLVLGPDKLPTLLKTVGKALREFRRATRDLRDQLDVDGTLREALGEPPLRPRPAPRITPPSRIYPPEGVDSEDVLEEASDYPPTTPYAAEEPGSPASEARWGAETLEPTPAAPASSERAPSTTTATHPAPTPPTETVSLPGPVPPPPAAPTPLPRVEAWSEEIDCAWGDSEGVELSLAPLVRPSAPPPSPPPAPIDPQKKRESHRERRARQRRKASSEPTEVPSGEDPGTEAGKAGRRRRGRK